MAEIRLDLEGMTCASCAARIEKWLNKLDGVNATVNFATERATVTCASGTSLDSLLAAVRGAGYDAREAEPAHAHHYDLPARSMRRRLVVAVVLSVPVALLAMVSPLQFSNWGWVAFA